MLKANFVGGPKDGLIVEGIKSAPQSMVFAGEHYEHLVGVDQEIKDELSSLRCHVYNVTCVIDDMSVYSHIATYQ